MMGTLYDRLIAEEQTGQKPAGGAGALVSPRSTQPDNSMSSTASSAEQQGSYREVLIGLLPLALVVLILALVLRAAWRRRSVLAGRFARLCIAGTVTWWVGLTAHYALWADYYDEPHAHVLWGVVGPIVAILIFLLWRWAARPEPR